MPSIPGPITLDLRPLSGPDAVLLLFAFKERVRIPPGHTVSPQDVTDSDTIHVGDRAVKFIRDQAVTKPTKPTPRKSVDVQPPQTKGIAQAMQMLRQSFGSRDTAGGLENILADAYTDAPRPGLNPLEGWNEGVSLDQSHFCVLLKPQIVLHSESSEDSTCVVAAGVTKFKVNNIMDNENADDPINGTIMSRWVFCGVRRSCVCLSRVGHTSGFRESRSSRRPRPARRKTDAFRSKCLLISDARATISIDWFHKPRQRFATTGSTN